MLYAIGTTISILHFYTSIWLWVKKGYLKDPIGFGKIDQNLWSLGGSFLTHSHMSTVYTCGNHERKDYDLPKSGPERFYYDRSTYTGVGGRGQVVVVVCFVLSWGPTVFVCFCSCFSPKGETFRVLLALVKGFMIYSLWAYSCLFTVSSIFVTAIYIGVCG